MLEQVLIETTLGALTGYVTNDIALKQLFRDGGFIEQEKDEFIEALLALLKDEIFTKEQVERILSTKEVEEAISQLGYKFLDKSVSEAFSHLALKDFPHHQKAKAILIKYLDQKKVHPGEPLINIEGIYNNFMGLIEGGELGLAIDKLLLHFAGESFKEVLGKNRFNTLIVEKISNENFFQEDYMKEKISYLYDELLESDIRLVNYISITPEKMSLAIISVLKEILTHFDEDKITKVVEKISNYKDGALIEILKTIEKQWIANIASSFVVSLKEKEDKLAKLLYESVQEATEDLGESLSSSILYTVKGYLAPNWLEREVLPQVSKLEIKTSTSKWLNQSREVAISYLSSDAFLDKINQLFTTFLNTPIGELLKKYGNKEIIVSLLCYLSQVFYNRGIIEKILLKLEQEPLGQWLLTPKVRIEIKEMMLKWLSSLEQERLYDLEKNYTWKKSIIEKTVDFLAIQRLDSLLNLFLSEEVKDSLAKKLTVFFKAFLSEKMSGLILNMLRSYLESLTQKEIRQLVNDLLGKELRPLSYLGGVVGFMTGLGVGMVGSNLPMTLSDSQGLLMRSFVYGAIGYGTNVLAVHSLFKPYQAVLGWQGLLPKNKHRFAKKMGEMTEKYIADEKIWQTYLSNWKNVLENDFNESKVMLSPQKYFYISLTGEWLDKPLNYFVKDRFDKVLLETAYESLKIFFKEEQFTEKSEKIIKEKLMPHFSDQFLSYGNKFNSYLWTTVLGDGISKLETNTEIFLHKILSRLFDKFENNGFLMQTVKSIHFPKQKTFYTFCAHKVMGYEEKFFSLLAKKERFLVSTLSDKLKHSLGFRAGLAYKMFGGDRYVARAVKIFLYKKLPIFFDEEREYIADVLGEFYYNHPAGQPLTVLGQGIEDSSYVQLFEYLQNQKTQEYIIMKSIFATKKYLIQPLSLWKAKNNHFSESIANYINQDLCYSSFQAVLFPHIERLLINVQRSALRQVLTGHINLLFPHWSKNLSRVMGEWKLSEIINRNKLYHLENMINQEEVKINKQILLAMRYYLRDGLTYLLPAGEKLLMGEMKSLLIAFDFSTIATRTVDNKNAKELEALLRGIANPYFRHVERMGLLGAGVALPATFLSRLLM